jgi:putative flippase GtrA
MISSTPIKPKRRMREEVIIYALVGLSALLVQNSTYFVAHRYAHIFPSVAMILGSLAGMIIAYIGHIKFTFRKHRYSKREFVKFLVTSAIGMSINVAGVRIITKVFLLSPTWGLAPTFIVPLITFLISKFWAFK